MQEGARGEPAAEAASPAGGRWQRAVLPLSAAVILVYTFLAVPNVFTVDGLIYRAMADSMVREGSFAIWNGYETYRTDALNLLFTVPVGDRLMPQYPGGWAFLAAPFYALGGVRGLFLLNALATIATAWLIRATLIELFGNARAASMAVLIFVFATFAFDYAAAVWPHAVTVLGIAIATWAAARAWRRERPVWALAAGLALGLAVNFRVDSILAVPALGFWLVAATSRPWASGALFSLGLVPGLLGAAAVNLAKFGIFLPITYGRSDGSGGVTSLSHYSELLPLGIAAVALTVALGFRPVRRVAYRPGMLAAAATVLVLAAALTPLRPMVMKLLAGAGAILVDPQLFRSALNPLLPKPQPDGTFLLYGYYKKALLQSLPWVAGCVVLAPRLIRGSDRAGLALLLLLPAALILPFALSAWVGGRGNHMRYMVNLLPALAILGGLALDWMLAQPGRNWRIAVSTGGAAVAAGLALGRSGNHEPVFILQNSVPNLLAVVLALASLALLLASGPLRSAAASATKGIFAAALTVAFLSAWGLDLAMHQLRRAKLMEITTAVRTVPADAVIHAVRPEAFFERVNRPPGIVALVRADETRYDPDFVRRVMAEGRALYVQQIHVAGRMVEDGVAGSAEPMFGFDPLDELYRMTPP